MPSLVHRLEVFHILLEVRGSKDSKAERSKAVCRLRQVARYFFKTGC